MNETISIIIVTYNNADTIGACLNALKKINNRQTAQVIIVDNASTDNTVELVKKYEHTEILTRKDNGGFAKAANEGIKAATGKYLLLLNPDAEIKPNALDEMTKAMNLDEKIGIAGGKFISASEKPMVSFGNFPSAMNGFWQKTRIAKIFPCGRYIVPSLFTKKLFTEKHEPDWVSGGFCLVRKDVLVQLGGFDEKYFLYVEDIDLAKRIRGLGYKIIFIPQAQAVHNQHRSNSIFAKKHEKDGLRYYISKFGS